MYSVLVEYFRVRDISQFAHMDLNAQSEITLYHALCIHVRAVCTVIPRTECVCERGAERRDKRTRNSNVYVFRYTIHGDTPHSYGWAEVLNPISEVRLLALRPLSAHDRAPRSRSVPTKVNEQKRRRCTTSGPSHMTIRETSSKQLVAWAAACRRHQHALVKSPDRR